MEIIKIMNDRDVGQTYIISGGSNEWAVEESPNHWFMLSTVSGGMGHQKAYIHVSFTYFFFNTI